jgi:hypothetical protein
MKRPVIEFYDDKEVVVIDGVKYSYGFFHALGVGGVRVGELIKIEERTVDGNVVLSVVSEFDQMYSAPKPCQTFDEDAVAELVDQIEPEDYFRQEYPETSEEVFAGVDFSRCLDDRLAKDELGIRQNDGFIKVFKMNYEDETVEESHFLPPR